MSKDRERVVPATGPEPMLRSLLVVFLTAALILLAGCGEVVTPEPTAEARSTSIPTTASTPTPRPTATAPLLPPADTATPTITPTPIVHVVQQGDTLQAIAFDYGVSVEALQTANAIENPKFLQVGQRLIIPVSEEGGEPSPGLLLPTPTPRPLDVQGIAFYETPVGSLWSLGEVVNTTAITITNVQLKVTLFDAAGEPLVEAESVAAADLLPPGAQSPFGILFTTPPPDWANYRVTIIRADDVGTLADSYVPITVTEVDGRPSGSRFQVNGALENVDPDRVAKPVHVIVTTYDLQGAVTGFREHILETDNGLAPGASASFDLLFTFHGDTPKDFNVTALGRVMSE